MNAATTLANAIQVANAADDAYSAAVAAAGFKSRWDVPHVLKTATPLREAFQAKVDADEALHAAFESSRS